MLVKQYPCPQGELLRWPIVRRPSSVIPSVRQCVTNFFKQLDPLSHLTKFVHQLSMVNLKKSLLSKSTRPRALIFGM